MPPWWSWAGRQGHGGQAAASGGHSAKSGGNVLPAAVFEHPAAANASRSLRPAACCPSDAVAPRPPGNLGRMLRHTLAVLVAAGLRNCCGGAPAPGKLLATVRGTQAGARRVVGGGLPPAAGPLRARRRWLATLPPHSRRAGRTAGCRGFSPRRPLEGGASHLGLLSSVRPPSFALHSLALCRFVPPLPKSLRALVQNLALVQRPGPAPAPFRRPAPRRVVGSSPCAIEGAKHAREGLLITAFRGEAAPCAKQPRVARASQPFQWRSTTTPT